MPYELDFREKALKEWKALDNSVREILKKKLEARLANPFVPNDALGAELSAATAFATTRLGIAWFTEQMLKLRFFLF